MYICILYTKKPENGMYMYTYTANFHVYVSEGYTGGDVYVYEGYTQRPVYVYLRTYARAACICIFHSDTQIGK